MSSSFVDAGPAAVPVPFATALETLGDRTALITADGALTYRELARRADEIAARLGPVRRLVLVAAGNDPQTVANYLGALRAGHVVLLTPRDPDAIDTLTRAYAPDVILTGADAIERHPTTAHTLHPDLALLLSTSGSTGSPKLVRLSHENLQANAEAIAASLRIRPDDRAATTLPLHYCYGLSVLNSHLRQGAAVILTCRSVTDPEFWALFRRERGTTFPAVPYTFDLLDRIGFADLDLPHLRYITQAGGRLAPDRVRRYAELGRTRGWDLVVMYGQTEATARMAYLPPDRAATAPDAVGVPIPGGHIHLDPVAGAGPDEGELVYRGPNVMLGYAEHPDDLGRGRDVDELRTGDIARRGADGLYRIVGRRSRFLKLFGLRVDLQRVESRLAEQGVTAYCAGNDELLVIAVEDRTVGAGGAAAVRRRVSAVTGLPASAISVHLCARIPRLASGKPDYPAIAALARAGASDSADDRPAVTDPAGDHSATTGPAANPVASGPTADPPATEPAADPVTALIRLYAQLLDRDGVTERHSFVDLGGDSLSYVEVSIRLEQLLGTLPPNWHLTPIAELAAAGPGPTGPRRRRLRRVETSVLLRAVAIVLVVGTHIQLFTLPGGAHTLLGVAGFNFARFRVTEGPRGERVRGIARSLGHIVATSLIWIALVMLVTDQYTLANLFLLTNVVGVDADRNGWHFWYIEDLAYIIVAATALLAVADRWERRWPLALPGAIMVAGLVARYQLVPGVELPKTLANAWLFAIGWAAARSTSRAQRVALSAVTAATIPGFFGEPGREAVMVVGLLLLIWVPAIPIPRVIAVAAGALASASLAIYLVHWQIYMHVWDISRLLALLASLAAGLAYAALFTRASRAALAGWQRVTRKWGRLDPAAKAALN
jgi:acyl-CoA synthetase (AMP-forming)/AMP-acid ligase II